MGQRLVVLELGANSRCRLPRRHRPFLGYRRNVARTFAGLLVGLKGERTDLMPSVAVLALRLEDRHHIPGIRGSRFFPLGRLRVRTRRFPSRSCLSHGRPYQTRRAKRNYQPHEPGPGRNIPRLPESHEGTPDMM